MADLLALRAELDADPLTRGYAGMTDKQASDDLNTYYRSANADSSSVFVYLLLNKNRTNSGTDTTTTNMFGRLQRVALGSVGQDPFGSTITLTLRMIHAAISVVQLVQLEQVVDWTNPDAESFLDDMIAAGVFKNPDKAAIQALSQNRQTRAQELNLGRVLEGTVTEARAL